MRPAADIVRQLSTDLSNPEGGRWWVGPTTKWSTESAMKKYKRAAPICVEGSLIKSVVLTIGWLDKRS